MAGMLPGVECARRRRCHQSSRGGCLESGGSGSSSRRSFCLYTSNYESPLTSTHSLQQRSIVNSNNQGNHQNDEKLGGVAREAKERLDERLRSTQRLTSQPNRNSSGQPRLRYVETATTATTATTAATTILSSSRRELQRGLKKSGSKRFSWAKLGWKGIEQEECAICLEQFKSGGGGNDGGGRSDDTVHQVVDLPCGHRFHSRCLVPWLATNSHCPCCRMEIWGN